MNSTDIGNCGACGDEFTYRLIHNGFNDSAFAYCDQCGATGFLSYWTAAPADSAKFKDHGSIPFEAEALLEPCPCGGEFKRNAAPRCPKCTARLDADAVAPWIERNAPGTAKGWRWQRTWIGLYAIIIADRSVVLHLKQAAA